MVALVATAVNRVLVHHGPVVGSLDGSCVLVVLLPQVFEFLENRLALVPLISLHLRIEKPIINLNVSFLYIGYK